MDIFDRFSAFITEENSIRQSINLYCDGSVQFNFALNKTVDIKKPFIKGPANYEERLTKLVSGGADQTAKSKGGVLLVRGAAGSGKTTALKLAAYRARRNLKRRVNPSRLEVIWLDFNSVEEIVLMGSNPKQQIWGYLRSEISRQGNAFSNLIPSHKEQFQKFFPWLLGQQRLIGAMSDVGRFVLANREDIVSYSQGRGTEGMDQDQLLRVLIERKTLIWQNLDHKEFLFLEVAHLKHWLETNKTSHIQPIVVVDNVDHLPPVYQIAIVEAASLIARILECQIIIAVRPLTWEAIHGIRGVSTIEHCSPNIEDVLEKRLSAFVKKADLSASEKVRLGDVCRLLKNKHRLLYSIVSSTSGMGIRAFLDNTAGFLRSRYVKHGALNNTDDSLLWSEISRAYIFGAGNSMNLSVFENLFSSNRVSNSNVWLIKGRILDYTLRVRAGRVSIQDLYLFLEKFGYEDRDIEGAINELLNRNRALLWSNEDFKVELGVTQPSTMIAIAPAGATYYSSLFGEYLYSEVCLAKDQSKKISPMEVIGFSRGIVQADFEESKYFVDRQGADEYVRIYPIEHVSISRLYLSNFAAGLKARAPQQYDAGWENSLRKGFEEITGKGYLRYQV